MMKLLATVVTAMILLAPLQANAQTTWFKYEHNPVMSYGAPGSWESFSLIFQRVIRVGDTLKMWYGGEPAFESNALIGYAWSTDGGINWTKYASNPVLTVTQSWEGNTVYSPYVVFTGTEYKMWYTGYYGPGKIGYARSPDGIHWTKYTGNPVISPGPSAWDAQSVSFPCVLADTNGLKMWYCGLNANYQRAQIGYATAPNETTWTKAQSVNPVLTPGTWDGALIRFQRVLREGQLYHMWYGGTTSYSVPSLIGHATSPDGVLWTKDSNNPVMRVGPGGSWDSQTIAMPEIFFDGIMYHMWYDAWDSGNHGCIGYAVSPKGMIVKGSPSVSLHAGDAVKALVRVDSARGLSYFAEIESPDGTPVDTIQLYDDGAHGDTLVGDGIFANTWKAPASGTYTAALKLRLRDTLTFELNNAAILYTLTSVSDAMTGHPRQYALEQNYPNPFNPTTTIRYSLPHRTHVALSVFNTLGQLVATLVNGQIDAGYHEVQFIADYLASGVYFYRFQAEDHVMTRSLVLIR